MEFLSTYLTEVLRKSDMSFVYVCICILFLLMSHLLKFKHPKSSSIVQA